MKQRSYNAVARLAMTHGAGDLVAAAAARQAAQILADTPTLSAIPDAVAQVAVEQFASLLRAALNSVVEQEC